MTIQKICDFCGASIEKEDNAKLVYNKKGKEKKLDICDNCLNILLKQKTFTTGVSRFKRAKRSLFGG